MARPFDAAGTPTLSRLGLQYADAQIDAAGPTRIQLANGQLDVPGLTLRAKAKSGQTAVFDLKGQLSDLQAKPSVDLRFTLQPTSLDGSWADPRRRASESTLAADRGERLARRSV